MTKKFAALARVSSREQEREGFSLEVQEEALQKYAERHNGDIVKMFKIAETASKPQERNTFRELLDYVKSHADELDGMLFYKLDRACRNLADYVELERLESEFGVEFISVSQPTENTPAGRMQRRMLASMASFYVEQQSVDVVEGLARRVQNGLFVGLAPYGYRNVRKEGRGLIEVHPRNAANVRRVFELYAFHNHTLDSLVEALSDEGVEYTPSTPRFPRSKLHAILRDRAYIGEVHHRGHWYEGSHEPIVDRTTWDRVQALLGDKAYRAHQLTYAGELITCGHCGHPITGEVKRKTTKSGEREYVYYRCTKYNSADHPRIRLTEADLDKQMLGLFKQLRVEDDEMREWFAAALRDKSREEQVESRERDQDLKRQHTAVVQQLDRLLNLRLLEEIDTETFAEKSKQLRDRAARLKLQLDAVDRGRDENADLAVRAFELSQSLQDKWVKADFAEKHRVLEIICLNLTLVDVTLVPEWRKPFDMLAEGLISEESRGDWI